MNNQSGHPDQHDMAGQGFRLPSHSFSMPLPSMAQQHASWSLNAAPIQIPPIPSHPNRGGICPIDDGYSWRKYGQQSIAGWARPTIYYECTQANCRVKKSVALAMNGQTVETVFGGSHNHSRPSERWPSGATAGPLPGSQGYAFPEAFAKRISMARAREGYEQLTSSSDSEDDDDGEPRADGDTASNANATERCAPAPAQRINDEIANEVDMLDGNWQQGSNPRRSERRRSKSKVWEEFAAVLNGDKIQSAECKHCKKCLSGKSSGGTSHLRRHLKICPARPGTIRLQQGQSSSHPDTSVEKNSKFDQDQSLELLTMALVSNLCSFALTSNTNFRKFLAGICPSYDMVLQHAVGEKFLGIFEDKKMKLKEEIALAPGGVFLAVSDWSLGTSRFICVTIHFIDNEWKMNQKIIRLSFSGDEIYDAEYYLCLFPDWQSYIKRRNNFNSLFWTRGAAAVIIQEAAQNWSLEKKILGITLPRYLRDADILELGENLAGQNYLLAKCKMLTLPCIIGSLHNLFGYDDINQFVRETSESWFHYMTCSPLRSDKYKEILSQVHLNRPSFGSQRWFLIYYLLEAALQFNKAWPNPERMDSLSYPSKPSHKKLEATENFCNLVRPIYHAIKIVSSCQNATLNTFFHAIWNLKIALLDSSIKVNVDQVLDVKKMQTNFDDLWKKWYLWLSLGVVLDPRYKFRFLDDCFKQTFGSDAKKYILEVRGKMYELFLQYSCHVDQQSDEQLNQRNNDLWLDAHGTIPIHDTSKTYTEQSAHEELRELIRYLDGDIIPRNINIDILKWWKDNASMYPTLARLARDILAIPGSAVSAESAFDETDDRVSLFNRKMSPEVIEALICTQDWIKSSEINDEVGGIRNAPA